MLYDYDHPQHKKAAKEARNRSEGWCQFCGMEEAEEAHHWRGCSINDYKPAEETTHEELTSLCRGCHQIATKIKQRYQKIRKRERRLNEREKNMETEIESRVEDQLEEERERIEEMKQDLGIGSYY
ncbi:MAG: hypothetical protein OXI35_00090 [Gemmatimonadota bacterium]|nr:hypothetical protein [Gemmatimonadota bacterium]